MGPRVRGGDGRQGLWESVSSSTSNDPTESTDSATEATHVSSPFSCRLFNLSHAPRPCSSAVAAAERSKGAAEVRLALHNADSNHHVRDDQGHPDEPGHLTRRTDDPLRPPG